jgi:hypothetical protein
MDNDKENSKLPGYPHYPASEDIYSKEHKERHLSPEDEDPTRSKNIPNPSSSNNSSRDILGNELDVPGSELDDENEKTGSEDEENNYYSIGGDNHEDLEEDQSI